MRRLWSHRTVRRLRSHRGASLVEAAFMTPLLLLLTFAVADFASVFYCYLALQNGVTQASRYGVTGNTMTSMTREQSIKTAMRDATPTLTIADTDFAFAYKPAAPAGAPWVSGSAGGPGDISKVTVTYTWSLMTPLISQFFTGGQVSMRVESAMKNESFTPPTP